MIFYNKFSIFQQISYTLTNFVFKFDFFQWKNCILRELLLYAQLTI